MLFYTFVIRKATVPKLISWKYSFKRLNEEYTIALKKKQALDNLFKTGRISEATRNSFENDINAVIMEIEKQQKDLAVKMQGKMQELENQIKTLETLLANYEIQHVVGEIDEESYQREITLLSTGLETAKRELDAIQEALNQLCSPVKPLETEPLPAKTIEPAQNTPIEDKPDVFPKEAETLAEPISEEPAIITEPVIQEPQSATISEEAIPTELTQTAESATEAVVEAAVENQEVTTEVPLEVEPIPEVVEETPAITQESSNEVEITVEAPSAEPEIKEDEVPITEDTVHLTDTPADVAEDVSPVIESSSDIVEEIIEKAHPQTAPTEAPQEVIVEEASEQEREIAEAAEDTEDNNETEET